MAMKSLKRAVLLTVVMLAIAWSAVAAESAEWGNLSGQITFEGNLDDPTVVEMRADIMLRERILIRDEQAGIRGRVIATIPNERLLIDEPTRGVKNVFVFLRTRPAAINPALEPPRPSVLELVARDHVFQPHALLVQVGQTVQMLAEGVGANFKVDPIKNSAANPLVKPGEPAEWKPVYGERLPIRVTSNIHPAGLSYWLVLDHPYGALSGADGRFSIEGLPTGEHELAIWHEVPGWLEKKLPVTIRADETTKLAPLHMTVTHLKRR
jgi:hypothetical protein